MAAIFQTTFWNGFSWMKMYEFWLKVQWILFLRVQSTIFQHLFTPPGTKPLSESTMDTLLTHMCVTRPQLFKKHWAIWYHIIEMTYSTSKMTYQRHRRAVYKNEPHLLYADDATCSFSSCMMFHDDVIKWKPFPRYWPFVRGIHQSPVNSPHKGQWRGALIFSLSCVWINGWVNNREAGDLRRYRAHYDVIVMFCQFTNVCQAINQL